MYNFLLLSSAFIFFLILIIITRFFLEKKERDGILYYEFNNQYKFIKYININVSDYKFSKTKKNYKYIDLFYPSEFYFKLISKTSDNINVAFDIKINFEKIIFDKLFSLLNKSDLEDGYYLRKKIDSLRNELIDYHINPNIHKLLLNYSKNTLIKDFENFKIELFNLIEKTIIEHNYPFELNNKNILIAYEWKI